MTREKYVDIVKGLSILWIFIFGMSFPNFAYTFGALMIWTCVLYFQTNRNYIN